MSTIRKLEALDQQPEPEETPQVEVRPAPGKAAPVTANALAPKPTPAPAAESSAKHAVGAKDDNAPAKDEATASAATPVTAEDVKRWFADGDAKLRQGMRKEACAMYGRIVDRDPKNTQGLTDLAYIKNVSLMVYEDDDGLRRQAYARIRDFPARFPDSAHTDYYTVIRATLAADLGETEEAAKLLQDFPDRFKDSRYAPLAFSIWNEVKDAKPGAKKSTAKASTKSGDQSSSSSKSATKASSGSRRAVRHRRPNRPAAAPRAAGQRLLLEEDGVDRAGACAAHPCRGHNHGVVGNSRVVRLQPQIAVHIRPPPERAKHRLHLLGRVGLQRGDAMAHPPLALHLLDEDYVEVDVVRMEIVQSDAQRFDRFMVAISGRNLCPLRTAFPKLRNCTTAIPPGATRLHIPRSDAWNSSASSTYGSELPMHSTASNCRCTCGGEIRPVAVNDPSVGANPGRLQVSPRRLHHFDGRVRAAHLQPLLARTAPCGGPCRRMHQAPTWSRSASTAPQTTASPRAGGYSTGSAGRSRPQGRCRTRPCRMRGAALCLPCILLLWDR